MRDEVYFILAKKNIKELILKEIDILKRADATRVPISFNTQIKLVDIDIEIWEWAHNNSPTRKEIEEVYMELFTEFMQDPCGYDISFMEHIGAIRLWKNFMKQGIWYNFGDIFWADSLMEEAKQEMLSKGRNPYLRN